MTEHRLMAEKLKRSEMRYARICAERNRIEEELKKQNQFLNTVVESLIYPFYIINVNDYSIRMSNSVAGSKIASERVTCYKLTHNRDTPCYGTGHVCPTIETVKTKKPATVEHTHYDKSGCPQIVEVHAYPIFDSEGNVSQTIEYCFDITERKRTESLLQERMKELACLYGISRSVERYDNNLDAIMSKVVSIIPLGYIYSDITCSRITLDNRIFESAGFKESRWSQSANIKIGGKITGTVEVFYLEEKPPSFEGPFLNEERNLIDIIAERLGRVVERKKVQDALKESEEKYRDLFENSTDLIQSVNNDGRFEYMNRKWLETLGYTQEEAKQLTLIDILRKDQVPHCNELFERVRSGEVLNHVETVFVSKDRKEIPVEGNINGQFKNSQFVASRAIFRDITERKRTENALKESEERYKAIFEGANDGFLATNMKTNKFVYANPKICEMTGYSLKELLELNVTDIHPKKEMPFILEKITKQLAGKLDIAKEIPVLRKDKTVFYCDINGKIIEIEGQKCMAGIFRDVTERRKVGKQIEQLAAIVFSSDDAIVGRTLDGIITSWNKGAEKMYGYTESEVVGKSALKLVPPDRIEEYKHNLKKISKGELVEHFETIRVKKDGTQINVSLTISPIRDPEEKIIGASIIGRDITEYKQVERLKDQFVSTVSHELRTPLTAIRASIGLLANGIISTLPEKGQHMLEIAVNNTDRLVRLINDILDSERLASGKTPMQRKQCSATQLVIQVADVMKPMAEKADISLSVESQDATLWADPDRIAQALTNLISNAIKFSPKGGRIWVTAELKENQMLFKVQDEGRGIPLNKLGLLFERFQQVDASDAREKGGTGLGLSISKSIVEQHNGKIWVESIVGKGSTFFFTLPLPQETQVPAQPEATTEMQSKTRVLIIEDNLDLANILATMLQRHDIQSHIAQTAGKGITLSKQIRPDMIVLDLILPDMDGSTVVQALREDNILRLVPLVVYTVKELNEQQKENLRLGETLFFTKSRIPPDQFEEKVTKFMMRILEKRGNTNVG